MEGECCIFYCGFVFSLNIMLLYKLHQKCFDRWAWCRGKRKQRENKVLEYVPSVQDRVASTVQLVESSSVPPGVAEDPRSRKLLLASVPQSQRLCCPYCLGPCQAELKDPQVKTYRKNISHEEPGQKVLFSENTNEILMITKKSDHSLTQKALGAWAEFRENCNFEVTRKQIVQKLEEMWDKYYIRGCSGRVTAQKHCACCWSWGSCSSQKVVLGWLHSHM